MDRDHWKIIQQGAEARVARTEFFGRPAIVKERFKKLYRHSILDEKLTRKRLVQESRSLVRSRKLDLDVPTVYFLDLENNCLYMEYIEGRMAKEVFNQYQLSEDDVSLRDLSLHLATLIGKNIALLHDGDIIHGDLTTSNLILRSAHDSLALIDFGLSMISSLVEDKAVDLYVLERSFLSSHPKLKHVFSAVIEAYRHQSCRGKETLMKLDEVRLRGRKRDMIG